MAPSELDEQRKQAERAIRQAEMAMDYGAVANAKAIMYQAALLDTRLSEIRDLLDKPKPIIEFRTEPVNITFPVSPEEFEQLSAEMPDLQTGDETVAMAACVHWFTMVAGGMQCRKCHEVM